MSALTLMSAIAPAVPGVPQGSTGEAASGFQSLLAALSGDDAAAPAAKGAAEPFTRDEGQNEAAVEAPTLAGFLSAPLPPSPPIPAAEEPAPAPAAGANGPAPRVEGAGADAVLPAAAPADVADLDGPPVAALPPAGREPVALARESGIQPREQTVSPVPADKASAARSREPQVQPVLAGGPRLTEPSPEPVQTMAPAAPAAEVLEAHARTGAPAPSASPPPPPPPPPPPLRPLAERTSRSLDAPVGASVASGDGVRAVEPARAPPATVATAAPVAAGPAAASADLAAAVAGDTADGGETDGTPAEQPLPGEGATTQTQAPAAARETSLSTLSRATIEATAQIAAQILRRLEGRSTRFEMALTPDELGRVDVRLDIDSEGRLNARLAFDNPAAATDLRGRADELRRQLEDAGFHLAEDAFEFADRDSGSSAFDRGQDRRGGSSRAFAAAARLNAETDAARPPRWMALSHTPAGVDMKV